MRLLVVSNESRPDSAPGQRDALFELVNAGWIKSVSFVSYKMDQSYARNFEIVREAVSAKNYDVLFVWSPTSFPKTRNEFDQLESGIDNRLVLYWEGDPWTVTGIKAFFNQMLWWAEISNAVFTVAGDPQKSHFEKFASKVILIPHTYCHVQFRHAELEPPLGVSRDSGFTMIGNQVATVPYLYGVPGSGSRFTLANLLKGRYRQRFHLYGSNWPSWLGASSVPYREQITVIRKDLFSVNWDNFPKHANYASDRLPISLLAGRPHITTKHPGESFYGNPDIGLIEVDSVLSAFAACERFIHGDPAELSSLGLEAYRWTKNRLSHRQAGQFMISKVNMDVPLPKIFPWSTL